MLWVSYVCTWEFARVCEDWVEGSEERIVIFCPVTLYLETVSYWNRGRAAGPEVQKTLLSASHLHPQHWHCKQVPGHPWLFTRETEIQIHVPCFHGKHSYLMSNHPSKTSFNQKYVVNGFLQLFMVLVLKCIAKSGILPYIDSTDFWYKIWKSIKAHYYKLCMYCGVICHH